VSHSGIEAVISARHTLGNAPDLRVTSLPGDEHDVSVIGDWTTLGLAQRVVKFKRELAKLTAHQRVSWDLSRLEKLDRVGALLLWRAWGRSFPEHLVIPATLKEYFTRLPSDKNAIAEPSRPWRRLRQPIVRLGQGVLGWLGQLRGMVQLIGRLLLDVMDLVRHPRRWPAREISAGVYRAGAQALGILALVGFLIGVVLSYLCGDQLRRFGAEMYVVNLLGVACVRELGPLLAAILVAGRSGSSMTAQLGVMRLNEEIDALTTIGVPYTQRLILTKVISLAISQPLVGLWTGAIALLGGMVAAHLSLGVGYYYFLDTVPQVVPIANYWIGLGKGVVFGVIIALVACHFGLRVKPNTESLGAGTTSSVVVAISSVLVADAIFAVLFSHVGM
jgi:phospholipid/cholesterol/gamma-HCH transport system permease protein